MDITSILIPMLIFVFSLSLYVALVSKVLPLFLLKAKYKASDMGDRGLKKYVFDGGRAITYKPCGETGRYIKQYVLFANDGDKYIKCRFDKRIYSVRYDVVALDSNDKEIETVQISEPTVHSGDAAAAVLPENTAYVCVVVKEVNGYIIADGPKMQYSFGKVITFVGVTAVLTVVEYLIVRLSVVSLIESMLPFAEPVTTGLPFIQMLVSVLAGVVLAGIILLLHRKKDVKIF